MSVSGISLPAVSAPQGSDPQNPRALWLQLVNAIRSGDLTSAQTALSAIQSQDGGVANGDGPFAQTFDQIATALNNNDIQGAQQALATLQQKMHGHHGHHHHGGSPPPTDPSSVTPTSSSNTNTNLLDVTA